MMPTLDELRVRRLVLEDAAGEIRGFLEAAEDGSVTFMLSGMNGSMVLLGAGDAPILRVVRGQDMVSVEVSDLAGGVVTVGRKSEATAQLSAYSPGYGPTLAFFDSDGATRSIAGLTAVGSPLLGMTDSDDTPRVLLGVADDGEAGLVLNDEDGDLLAELP